MQSCLTLYKVLNFLYLSFFCDKNGGKISAVPFLKGGAINFSKLKMFQEMEHTLLYEPLCYVKHCANIK